MKILIFSDIHIHPHKRSAERLNHCLEALEWTFSTAEEMGIRNVVFLGDLFHDRQKIDVLTYQKTFEVLEKHLDGDLNLFLLLGNHDLWHYEKLDVSSVNPLRTLPGVRVVNSPCIHEISDGREKFHFAFLPYTHDPVKDVATIDKMWRDSTRGDQPKVLGGHISVDGAFLNTFHRTVSDVTIEHDGDMVRVGPGIFDGWDRVFLGHYHAAQKLNERVEYVGSPLQLSFGEAFQKKHVVILDTETMECEYVENTFSPKHLIIGDEDMDKHDLKGNFVRLEVDDIASKRMAEVRERLVGESGVSSLEIKQSQRREEHSITDAKAILHKEEEMIQRYVDQASPEGLDKEELVKIGTRICEMGEAT